MARVVCDELARQAYDSSTDVFVKRLLQLREMSEDWSQIDSIRDSSSAATAAAVADRKKPVTVVEQQHQQRDVSSGNDLSDNDDNDLCDVSMVCDEIPSTSDYATQERTARPATRQFSLCSLLTYNLSLFISFLRFNNCFSYSSCHFCRVFNGVGTNFEVRVEEARPEGPRAGNGVLGEGTTSPSPPTRGFAGAL